MVGFFFLSLSVLVDMPSPDGSAHSAFPRDGGRDAGESRGKLAGPLESAAPPWQPQPAQQSILRRYFCPSMTDGNLTVRVGARVLC